MRRKLLGISQTKLADAPGLTFQQVQKYERGADRIGSSRLFDLSRVLDVSIEHFFEDMPADVAASSPAAKKRGKAKELPSHASNPMAKRETQKLVRAPQQGRDDKSMDDTAARAAANWERTIWFPVKNRCYG